MMDVDRKIKDGAVPSGSSITKMQRDGNGDYTEHLCPKKPMMYTQPCLEQDG